MWNFVNDWVWRGERERETDRPGWLLDFTTYEILPRRRSELPRTGLLKHKGAGPEVLRFYQALRRRTPGWCADHTLGGRSRSQVAESRTKRRADMCGHRPCDEEAHPRKEQRCVAQQEK